jgi:hypothetical protein
MKKDAVERMIDNIIKKSFKEGQSPIDIIQDLEKRSKNIFRIIEKQNLDMSSLFGVLMGDVDINDESIPKRVKYAYFYVNHCNKRLKDMKWVIKKRTDLFIMSRKYTDKNVYDLLILKEKLS